MTDKQMIKDGVDVSGCKHYKNRTCIADYCLTDMPFGEAKCELNPNCHYKQFKRKEQECETLASQLDFEVQKKECLEQECERLKEEDYKKVWCDMLLNKIEEIAQEKYPDVEYWIDTGSRLNCALEMLDTFKRNLKQKQKTNFYKYIKDSMPYMGG